MSLNRKLPKSWRWCRQWHTAVTTTASPPPNPCRSTSPPKCRKATLTNPKRWWLSQTWTLMPPTTYPSWHSKLNRRENKPWFLLRKKTKDSLLMLDSGLIHAKLHGVLYFAVHCFKWRNCALSVCKIIKAVTLEKSWFCKE